MISSTILDPSELRAHLDILRAFHDLKSQVEEGNKLEPDVHTLSPEQRWKSFVQASVKKYDVYGSASCEALTFSLFRFHSWVSSLKVDDNGVVERIECPPLDVCLVWHAYMLNPRWAVQT